MFCKANDIKIAFKVEEDEHNGHKIYFPATKILIDNVYVNHFTDIHALFYMLGKSNSNQSEVNVYHKFNTSLGKYVEVKDSLSVQSNFYPFTCSCGVAGCNGIWEGVYQKTRKHTVEWRIKDKDNNGYKFLDKSFYRFNKYQFYREMYKVYKFIMENPQIEIESDYDEPTTLSEEFKYLQETKPLAFKEILV